MARPKKIEEQKLEFIDVLADISTDVLMAEIKARKARASQKQIGIITNALKELKEVDVKIYDEDNEEFYITRIYEEDGKIYYETIEEDID